MNKQQFNDQFREFCKQSVVDGRFDPLPSQMHPVLNEDGDQNEFSYSYVMHTAWAARILNKTNPRYHVDFSSYLYFSALVSAFIPMTFYDYRPVRLLLPNFTGEKTDLTNLFFQDNVTESVSCLHVIEHLGLGRYGDPIDAQADLKAASELKRTLAYNGNLLIVVPMNKQSRVVFNAHRLYSYEQVMGMFHGLFLKEFSLINNCDPIIYNADPKQIIDTTDLADSTGLFWFTK